jgi:hypothetical protein
VIAQVSPVSAERKARKLLLGLLTPEQESDLKTTKAFNVRGSDGKLYRLTPRRAPSHWACVYLEKFWYGGDCDCPSCRAAFPKLKEPVEKARGMCVFPLARDGRTFPQSDWAISTMLWLMHDAAYLSGIACKDTLASEWIPERNGGDYGGRI